MPHLPNIGPAGEETLFAKVKGELIRLQKEMMFSEFFHSETTVPQFATEVLESYCCRVRIPMGRNIHVT